MPIPKCLELLKWLFKKGFYVYIAGLETDPSI